MRTFLLTLITLVAFAANSVLNRMALKDELIDPVTFTQMRLLSAALFLLPFFWVRRAHVLPITSTDWRPALALFVYALAFSLAYFSLSAATGALVLFGMVQFTMIGTALVGGSRPRTLQWLGLAAAFAGLSWLVAPGLTAPDPVGAGLMALAGLAWGAYSILGRSAADPIAATARNFVLAAPLAVALMIWPLAGGGEAYWSTPGLALALASGVIASGAGYVIWYMALRNLSAMTASVSQLAVPAIAAMGGVLFLAEPLTTRLVIASVLILGGIYAAVRFERAEAG